MNLQHILVVTEDEHDERMVKKTIKKAVERTDSDAIIRSVDRETVPEKLYVCDDLNTDRQAIIIKEEHDGGQKVMPLPFPCSDEILDQIIEVDPAHIEQRVHKLLDEHRQDDDDDDDENTGFGPAIER